MGFLLTSNNVLLYNIYMNQEEDPMDWDDIMKLESSRRVELLTKAIVEKAKREVQETYGNKKRHRQ
jgi:hypothetical protein